MTSQTDYRNYRKRAKERLNTSLVILTAEEKGFFGQLIETANQHQVRRIFKMLHLQRLRKLLFLAIECVMKGNESSTTVAGLIAKINENERGEKI